VHIGCILRWYCECLSSCATRRKSKDSGAKRQQGAGQHIALAVARGLHWLHTNGIVHGDLRPSKGVCSFPDVQVDRPPGMWGWCCRAGGPRGRNREALRLLCLHAVGQERCLAFSQPNKPRATNVCLRAVLLGDKRSVKLADAGLAALMHIDYMAAKSNVGPFSWTVCLTVSHPPFYLPQALCVSYSAQSIFAVSVGACDPCRWVLSAACQVWRHMSRSAGGACERACCEGGILDVSNTSESTSSSS